MDPLSISTFKETLKEGIVNILAASIYAYLSPLNTGHRRLIPAGNPRWYSNKSTNLSHTIHRFPNSPHATMYPLAKYDVNISI